MSYQDEEQAVADWIERELIAIQHRDAEAIKQDRLHRLGPILTPMDRQPEEPDHAE